MVKTILLPQTYLPRDASKTLANCFDEICLLKPSGLAEEQPADPATRSEVFKLLETTRAGETVEVSPVNLPDLVNQWRDWIADQRSSGNVEIIKAGVKPRPPDRETSRAIRSQIKSGRILGDQSDPPPFAPPGLVLHLAHLLDKQKDEIDRSLGEVTDSQERRMSELLGLNPDDDPPTEFRMTDSRPPNQRSPEVEDESMTAYRLQAWAFLAPPEKIKNLTPLTLSRQAALLLMDRVNQISDEGAPVGVESFLRPRASAPKTRVAPAREVLRLKLPRPEEAAGFKDALALALKALADNPLSPDLLESLEEIGGHWLESSESQNTTDCLSLIVLPGYDMAGLLNLMKGRATEPRPLQPNYPLLVIG